MTMKLLRSSTKSGFLNGFSYQWNVPLEKLLKAEENSFVLKIWNRKVRRQNVVFQSEIKQ